MPNYGFICENCNHTFDSLLSIDDRDAPSKSPCPGCKKKKIKRDYNSTNLQVGSDTNINANKATGGKWEHLMHKIKSKTPKRVHKNLDKATAMTGQHWKG
jgi:putative FmdB family regulatory protein